MVGEKEEVLELAKRSETAIYTIGLRSRDRGGRGFQEAEFVLRQLAQETAMDDAALREAGVLRGARERVHEAALGWGLAGVSSITAANDTVARSDRAPARHAVT